MSSYHNKEEVNRVYIGNLPVHATQADIEDLFQRHGRISRCDIKRTVSGAPFAFVEFDDHRDAKDAIEARDGYNFDGCRLRVEIPFNARPEGQFRGAGGDRRGGGRRLGGQRGKYRVTVSGLPTTGSWQDLKDHMRKAGECGHADVFGDGNGVIEFFRREDAEKSVRMFDASTFTSHEGDRSTIYIKEDYPENGGRGSPSVDRRGDERRRSYGRYYSRSPYDSRESMDRRGRGCDRGGGDDRYDRHDRRGGRSSERGGRGSHSGGRYRNSYSNDRPPRRDRSRSRSRDRR